MAGKSGSDRRAMPSAALVRLPIDLAASLRAAASTAGLSDAAWLRATAVAALGAAPIEARPTRPRRGPPSFDVVAVARLREAVGEAVGALVRSAAFTREQGDVHAALEALIPRFRQAATDLDDLKAALLP